MNKKRLKVAFVCVHNSCRSQMAEAIARVLAQDVFDAYSAGTDIKKHINEDAVEVIKRLYGVDMRMTQNVKEITDIPAIDIVITMGCNMGCPVLRCQYREDWGLEDPTGKGMAAFLQTAAVVREKILLLKKRIINGEIDVFRKEEGL